MADITWRTTVLPDAYWGSAYEASLAETGSLTAVTACIVATGALPPGLAISADFVRITGTISGVGATLPKVYTFTLTMTDTAGGVTSPTFTITVREPQGNQNIGHYGSASQQQAALWPQKY